MLLLIYYFHILPASLLPPEVSSLEISPYSSVIGTPDTSADYHTTLLDQGQIGSRESDMNLTVSQKQRFTIQEISPEWGYSTEATKVCFMHNHIMFAAANI